MSSAIIAISCGSTVFRSIVFSIFLTHCDDFLPALEAGALRNHYPILKVKLSTAQGKKRVKIAQAPRLHPSA